MRYLSVCSGIEAASVAWHHLKWTPVAFSEIEPFPAAVLKHRFPNVPNYGDMTKHKEWPLEPGSIDLLVGGTPCQSFSVAGLRKGLSDPRGGLMLTYLEIAQRLRPRWFVWENVPGVLSSGRGRDFGSFLGALVELGYGVAYRVLDAQWVRTQRHPRAVPQRRRRIFVVGCLGDWERAAQVLFERESVCRDSAKGGATGEGSAADVEGCAATVSSKWAKGTGGPAGDECYNLTTQPAVYAWQNNDLGLKQDSVTAALRSSAWTSGFHEMNHPVVVQQPVAVAFASNLGTRGGDVYDNGVSPTVRTGSSGTSGHPPAVAFTPGNLARGAGPSPNTEVAPSQRCSAGRGSDDQQTCVAFPIDTQNMTEGHASGGLGFGQHGDPSFTVTKGHSHAVAHALRGEGFDASEDGTGRGTPLVPHAMTVRRLTPRECERLQGFPDDWTLIPWRGKPAEQCPDGPRYKALGNSMAVNCMAWIGERIAAAEASRA